MHATLRSTVLAALLLQTPFALAQESDGTADTTEDAAEATEEAPSDLALGEPVGPQPGQAYVRETFVDWSLRCVKAPEGQPDACNLYQLLTNEEGLAVAEFNLFRLPEGGRAIAGANVVVPLETLLTQQLTIAVDGANARRYPFTFCNAAGCVARIGLTADEINEFKRGVEATVRVVPAANPDAEVILPVSLSGFTAGFEASTTPAGE